MTTHLVRQAANEVRRETFNVWVPSRTTVIQPNGSQIVTILGRDGTVFCVGSMFDPQA